MGLQPSPEGSWQENTQLKGPCNQLNFFFNISLELPGCLRFPVFKSCSARALSPLFCSWILSTGSCSAASFLCWEGLARPVATQLGGVMLEKHCWGLLGKLQTNPAKPPELRVRFCLKPSISSCLSGLALTLGYRCVREGP